MKILMSCCLSNKTVTQEIEMGTIRLEILKRIGKRDNFIIK